MYMERAQASTYTHPPQPAHTHSRTLTHALRPHSEIHLTGFRETQGPTPEDLMRMVCAVTLVCAHWREICYETDMQADRSTTNGSARVYSMVSCGRCLLTCMHSTPSLHTFTPPARPHHSR